MRPRRGDGLSLLQMELSKRARAGMRLKDIARLGVAPLRRRRWALSQLTRREHLELVQRFRLIPAACRFHRHEESG